MDDLFSSGRNLDGNDGSNNDSQRRLPLAVRMRPRTLDETVGQGHLLKPGSPLRVLTEGLEAAYSTGVGPASIILYGPPGTGKTTFAHVIARGGIPGARNRFIELSAVTAGVKNVRKVMEDALLDRDLHGRITVLFLDEIHRFNKAQQDALLPGVENRWVVLIAATTENPVFSVVKALLSRSLVLDLKPLNDDDIAGLVDRAIADPRGLNGEFALDPEAKEHIVRSAAGDARRALTALEAAAAAAASQEVDRISLDHAENALDRAMVLYDRQGDQHYDVASAFIKSMRGSDVDAAMHYLARMLEAGEDPRFIARRMIILASEDIGLADSYASVVAVNAAQAVALVGMPEARIILAQAVAYLATAPKSNAAYVAIDAAIADIRVGKGKGVPKHLRDQHYVGSGEDRKARAYKYSHDEINAVATQQYPPDDLLGVDYYRPTEYGEEKEIAVRVARLRKIIRGR